MDITMIHREMVECHLNPREQFVYITGRQDYLGGMEGGAHHQTRTTKVLTLAVYPQAFDLQGTDLCSGEPVRIPALSSLDSLPPYHRRKVGDLQHRLRGGSWPT